MKQKEKQYIKEAQDGDDESFGLIYEYYVSQIHRFISFKVSNAQTAEDIAHEVFLSAWKNINRYRQGETPFSSWLYRIARNKIIDSYRNNKGDISMDTEGFDIDSIGSCEQVDLDKVLNVRKVKEMLKLLSPNFKKVIVMRYIKDMDHKEIAKALKKTENEIRVTQHRAIKKLRELCEKYK